MGWSSIRHPSEFTCCNYRAGEQWKTTGLPDWDIPSILILLVVFDRTSGVEANVVQVKLDLDSNCTRDESGSSMQHPWTEEHK